MKKKILFLDDDEIILETFKYVMTELNYEVVTYSNSIDCLNIALSEDFDLIITDIRMPELNGIEFIKRVKSVKPQSNIYVLTSYPDKNIVKEALSLGALGLMEKPFHISKIVSIINSLK